MDAARQIEVYEAIKAAIFRAKGRIRLPELTTEVNKTVPPVTPQEVLAVVDGAKQRRLNAVDYEVWFFQTDATL